LKHSVVAIYQLSYQTNIHRGP